MPQQQPLAAIALFGLVLAGSGLISITQDASDTGLQPAAKAESNSLEALGMFFCDPSTWEVVGPNPDRKTYEHLNTPELIERRRIEALPMPDPGAYAQSFPKIAEQAALERQVAFSMVDPAAYQTTVAKIPEQRAAEERALWVILNPAEAFAELQQTLGVEAGDAVGTGDATEGGEGRQP
jgi:hypothetical protein